MIDLQNELKWEPNFKQKHQAYIMQLLLKIYHEQLFDSVALQVGKKGLMEIKRMANSAYSSSLILANLYDDHPKILKQIVKKISTNREIPRKEHILISLKIHEYHVMTEEMNIMMSLFINFKKLRENTPKNVRGNPETWWGKLNLLSNLVKNNEFIDYLKKNSELRNAIAHGVIWYHNRKIYYYSKKIGIGKPNELPLKDFLEKTRELNKLVLLFFHIFVVKKWDIIKGVESISITSLK